MSACYQLAIPSSVFVHILNMQKCCTNALDKVMLKKQNNDFDNAFSKFKLTKGTKRSSGTIDRSHSIS